MSRENADSLPQLFVVRPAVFTPVVLSTLSVIAAVQQTWWWLAALPFIWLGSACAQPNGNLVQGCLAYLSMIVGLIVTTSFKPLGEAILAGSLAGFYLSVIEKRLRMRPDA